MKIECNIFKDVWDKDCSNVTSITSVLKGIKTGHWKDKVLPVREAKKSGDKEELKNLKFRLPAVTWSGVFEEREDNACVCYNKLMVIDIDEISNKRLEKLKIELLDNPWVYAYFDGPTKGIKVLVFIDSDIDWHNTHAFQHLESAFQELYGIQIDKSGKNASRLCFISYDPDLYINPNPEELHIEKYEGRDSFMTLNNADYENAQPSTNGKYIMDVCVKMVKKSKVGTYHKGNRNNYVFSLACLTCKFGINPELALNLIFSKYPSLGFPEVKSAVTSAYKICRKDFGTMVTHEKKRNNQQSLL